jgi:hypothetical protein
MVLFSATNGRLYRFTFAETRKGEDDAGRGGNRPSPLVWQCTPPGGGDVRIGDPTWPTDPRLCGRIVVSLRTWEGADPEHGFSRPRLWWLQLSRDGTKIEGAGRLTRPDPDADERWPALASDPDGNLTLAFMERRDGRPGWRLRLAPVAIHRETGVPRAARPIGISQDEACLPVPPVFSTDGRWVHTLSGAEQSLARVDRGSVSEILAGGAERPGPTRLADIHGPGDGSTLPR